MPHGVLRLHSFEAGYILIPVLMVIFALVLLIADNGGILLRNQKASWAWQNEAQTFSAAEQGLQGLVALLEGNTADKNKEGVKTRYKILSIDDCGNRVVDLESIASGDFSTVDLKSRDFFASNLQQKNCIKQPKHQRLAWNEN